MVSTFNSLQVAGSGFGMKKQDVQPLRSGSPQRQSSHQRMSGAKLATAIASRPSIHMVSDSI